MPYKEYTLYLAAMLFSNSICHMLFFQADRMPDHKIWLYLSGISCEGQPLPSERAWLDLQSSRRGRSKTIRAAKTGNSQVGRGLLIHLISNKIYQNVRLKWLLMITYAISKLIWLGYIYFLKVIKAKKKKNITVWLKILTWQPQEGTLDTFSLNVSKCLTVPKEKMNLSLI